MVEPLQIVRSVGRWLGLGAVIALFALSIMNTRSGPAEGTVAPAVAGLYLDGRAFSPARHAGRPLVLNFWATWCPPCLAELPEFERASQTYKDSVAIVGLAVESAPEEIAEIVRRYELSYDIVIPHPGVQRAFQVSSFPTTVIVGPDGTVLHSHGGAIDFELLSKELAPLLRRAS